MTVKTIVVSSDKDEPVRYNSERGYEKVDLLGDSADDIGLRIDEIVASISDSIRNSIDKESELSIEITGSASFKGDAQVKWLVFNVGGSATESETLKVTLKTKILPK